MRLSQLEKCWKCGKGLAHTRLPLMVRFEAQSEMFNEQAIRRAHGMEELMGGNIGIARVMGQDEEISTPHGGGPVKGYLCMTCAMDVTVGELAAAATMPLPKLTEALEQGKTDHGKH